MIPPAIPKQITAALARHPAPLRKRLLQIRALIPAGGRLPTGPLGVCLRAALTWHRRGTRKDKTGVTPRASRR